MKRALCILILILFIPLVSAVDCNNGYEFRPRTGVGCVQIDCGSVSDAHYSYVGDCVCGSSGSIEENPNDPNVECHRDADYEACPGCVYACVHAGENCPDDITPHVALPEDYGSDDDVDDDDEYAVDAQNDEEREAELERLTEEYIVMPNKTAVLGQKEYVYDDDELDENACSPAEYAVFYRHEKTGEIFSSCACRPGFKRGEKGCVFDKPDIPLSDMDMKNLEKALLALQPNENILFESRYSSKNIRIGIVRKADYELAFTVDGQTWDSDAKSLINPSLWQSTKKGWDKAWGMLNPINWFNWHTKYKDEDKELKWQVADATLKRYDKDITKPKHYMYAVESWYKYAEDKRQALITLRDSGFIDGSIDLSKNYAWADLKGNLETFPAQAVHKFASELRTDDFAQAFSIYANMRGSRSPKDIMNDPGEELDLAISAGTASTLGDVILYQKYEEAYQRYLLAKKFKK